MDQPRLARPSARLFAAPDVRVQPLPGGGTLFTAAGRLAPHPPRVTDALWRWQAEAPDRIFLAERGPDGDWRRTSYAAAAMAVRGLAAGMLAQGLSATRPVAFLSGNSIAHALLGLAAQAAGIPFAPISTPYSLLSTDHAKLRQILARLRPGLIAVEDPAPFAAALAVEEARGISVLAGRDAFAAMAATPPPPDLTERLDAVHQDACAKVLFTSGSTGAPKGVITTHRMMAANQQQIRQVWPFLDEAPPVLLDWLPWSHVFGGSHNLNMVLVNGGTLFIDAGRPMPGAHEATIANIADVAATIRLDVPRGWAMLIPRLERDAGLRRAFFAPLRLMFCAGAALPLPQWRALQAMARDETGDAVPMTSSWGLTETAPAATMAHGDDIPPGCIGTPLPGIEAKLLPAGDKTEIRLRGCTVTPGYWDDPAATRAAFDADGFFLTGDAVAFLDPAEPARGLRFDGRLVEDFKLLSGTRINAADVRVRALAHLGGLVRDVVVMGADRDEVGMLIFPADPARATDADWCDAVLAGLRAANAASGGGSSRRVARALALAEPPSLDANELTDKGSLNVRAIALRRAADIEALYGDDPRVMRP